MATLTAWAQIAQSMPSVLISTCSSSARADVVNASVNATIAAVMMCLFMGSYFNQKKYAKLTAIRTCSFTEAWSIR
jgi:hypothetical protein